MQLILALTGNLAATLEADQQAIKRALSSAAEVAAMEVRDWWRADMTRQGMSKRMRNTVKFKVYPRRGTLSLSPSLTVFSLAPKIMRGMTEATTIKSPGGAWLAIPTDNAPVRLKGKRPTPDLYEQVYGSGRLRFVETRLGRSGILIDDDVRTRSAQTKSGRSRSQYVPRTKKSRSAVASAVMFTLVREVRTKVRFSLPDYETRGTALLAAEVRRALAALASGEDASGAQNFDGDPNSQSARQSASAGARRAYDGARTARRRERAERGMRG
jgi:hypothetical protein